MIVPETEMMSESQPGGLMEDGWLPYADATNAALTRGTWNDIRISLPITQVACGMGIMSRCGWHRS